LDDVTPFSALLGGVLIGLAAVTLMLFSGQIAGISGILGGLFDFRRGDVAWCLAFMIGLITGTALAGPIAGFTPAIQLDGGIATLIVAGVLVGFGTRLGSGCTSGHGVCGLARLSPRSMVATGLFMVSGIAVVFLVRHVLGA
jgi:uncharacterized protein